MPRWLEPMAATLTQERFAGGEWLFERKFDGIRLLAYRHGDEVRLFSRNQLPRNLLFDILRWLKMKCEASQELVVGGFTDPRGARVGLGALLVGYYEGGGDFVFAGKIGTGFDTRLLLDLRARLREQP